MARTKIQSLTTEDIETAERARSMISLTYKGKNKKIEFSDIEPTPDGKYIFSYWATLTAEGHAENIEKALNEAKEDLKILTLCETLTNGARAQITALNEALTNAQHVARELREETKTNK